MGLSECRKLKILVDCDNVLEDLLIPWVAALNEKYDRKIRVEDIKQWDLCNCYPGLSRTQVFSPLHTPELWASLEPLPSSQFYLKKLIEDGHRVVIVTSAHPDTIPYKWKFIEKNYPFVKFNDIIFASDKQSITGDILIDDAPHNLEGGGYRGILFDCGHNRGYNEKQKGFVRVKTWDEIYDLITGYAKGEKKIGGYWCESVRT